MKVLWCCVVKGFRLRFKVNSGFYFDLNYLSVYLLYISKMFSFTKIALILSGLAASAFAQESIESQDFSIDSASDFDDDDVFSSQFRGGGGGAGSFNPSLFRDYPGYSWFPYPHATYPLRTLPNIPFGAHLPPTYFGGGNPRLSYQQLQAPMIGRGRAY